VTLDFQLLLEHIMCHLTSLWKYVFVDTVIKPFNCQCPIYCAALDCSHNRISKNNLGVFERGENLLQNGIIHF